MVRHDSGAIEVQRGADQPVTVIAELTEAAVAVEAENSAHFAGPMIVVDVFGIWSQTHDTDATLRLDELIELVGTDAVSTLQVIVTTTAVQSIAGFLAAGVVACLAIRVATISQTSVARELLRRLPLFAVRTALHGWNVEQG
jgi:hypothetical protein